MSGLKPNIKQNNMNKKVKIKLTVITPKNTDYIEPTFEVTKIRFDNHQTTIPNN